MAQRVSILETVVVITVKLQEVMGELLMVIQVLLILLVALEVQQEEVLPLAQEDLVEAVEVQNLNQLDLMAVLVK